jgi:tRNA1Val (adenine37-N6)-methyltransferase
MAKSGKHFHFKKFSVAHDRSTMKVGTDGVLLGAWTDVSGATRLLDVGTGSGVIALILAQRSGEEAHVDALEIEQADAEQAQENVQASPWPHKVSVFHRALQNFESAESYDRIVSNPPYFIQSYLPPDEGRKHARHNLSLNFDDLLSGVVRLLKRNGKFSVILPITEGIKFIDLAAAQGFYVSRRCNFRSRKEKPLERILLEFGFYQSAQVREEELLLYENGEVWSPAYQALTRDLYLYL